MISIEITAKKEKYYFRKISAGNNFGQLRISDGLIFGQKKIRNFVPPKFLGVNVYYSNKIFEQSIQNIQRNLNKLDIWCKTWRIGHNPSKSKIIVFNHRLKRQLPSSLNLKLQNTAITVFNEAKFLGVTFDNRLNFKNHIEEITKEVRKTYFYILNLKSRNYGPTNKVMIQLFKTFIRSKMEYGSPCLITVPKNLLSSWESLQIDLIKHTFNFSTYINHNIIR